MPDALKHFSEPGAGAVGPVHELGHVCQAHIPLLEFFGGQDPESPPALILMAFKRKIHLLDPESFGLGPKLRFRSFRSAAEQNKFFARHGSAFSSQANSRSYDSMK